MEKLDSQIRNAVRAVIIRNQQILLLLKEGGDNGEHYALPGGAQEVGETLEQTLIRECIEEINSPVTVGELIHAADFFKYKTPPQPHVRHQLELLFFCSVPDDYQPQNGGHPDKHQVDVEWIDLDTLTDLTLSPLFFSEFLAQINKDKASVYLGSVR
ncbi:MAG: NUDIX domain-containing protein [Methylococcaceae bacterium]|nr:NUDIX domain-containing protein [Methylococcaceae bacterium]